MSPQPYRLHRLQRLASAGLLSYVALAGCVADHPFEAGVSSDFRAKRILRTELRPADAPYGAADLARAFQDIVFRYEFHFQNGQIVDRPIAKPLKRWVGTVRYGLTGDAVDTADHATVAALFSRIAPLTGLRFEETSDSPDMLITIATNRGQEDISDMLAETGQHTYRERYDLWRRTPGWVCGATLSSSSEDPNRLIQAHVFIDAETRGLHRQSCLHEEIVQSLGLTNDSDRARPSIFNDDQEFALLTAHDEALLAVLYSPELEPGASAEQARPVARRLFEQMFGKSP